MRHSTAPLLLLLLLLLGAGLAPHRHTEGGVLLRGQQQEQQRELHVGPPLVQQQAQPPAPQPLEPLVSPQQVQQQELQQEQQPGQQQERLQVQQQAGTLLLVLLASHPTSPTVRAHCPSRHPASLLLPMGHCCHCCQPPPGCCRPPGRRLGGPRGCCCCWGRLLLPRPEGYSRHLALLTTSCCWVGSMRPPHWLLLLQLPHGVLLFQRPALPVPRLLLVPAVQRQQRDRRSIGPTHKGVEVQRQKSLFQCGDEYVGPTLLFRKKLSAFSPPQPFPLLRKVQLQVPKI